MPFFPGGLIMLAHKIAIAALTAAVALAPQVALAGGAGIDIPEPSTLALLAGGAAAWFIAKRRRG
jgi:hypothetical protein